MPQINTIEEARAEIVRLNDLVTERTNERDTLAQNNETLTNELESVRKLNQRYFERISAQTVADKEDEGGDPQSCEDFAKTINLF